MFAHTPRERGVDLLLERPGQHSRRAFGDEPAVELGRGVEADHDRGARRPTRPRRSHAAARVDELEGANDAAPVALVDRRRALGIAREKLRDELMEALGRLRERVPLAAPSRFWRAAVEGEAVEERNHIQTRPPDDDRLHAARDERVDGGLRTPQPVRDAERLAGVPQLEEMARNAAQLLSRRRAGADVQPPDNLARVGVDELGAPEPPRDRDGERRLPDASRPDNRDEPLRRRRRTPATCR